jgi:hypothetical protein
MFLWKRLFIGFSRERRQCGEWFDISVQETFNAVVSVANRFGYAVSQYEVNMVPAIDVHSAQPESRQQLALPW